MVSPNSNTYFMLVRIPLCICYVNVYQFLQEFVMAGRPHQTVDEFHRDNHTQTIEGLWMQANRKLHYQSGTSNGLFRSYLSAFQWRFSHKEHVFRVPRTERFMPVKFMNARKLFSLNMSIIKEF